MSGSAMSRQLPMSLEIEAALTRGAGRLGQVLRVVSAYERGDLHDAASAYRGEDLPGSILAAMRWSTLTLASR
jgi:EAL and modified HD-GYP domain-containing signal transduction protein